jgi:hypothetical protein
MGKQAVVALYVLALIAAIVGVDVLFSGTGSASGSW